MGDPPTEYYDNTFYSTRNYQQSTDKNKLLVSKFSYLHRHRCTIETPPLTGILYEQRGKLAPTKREL